MESHGGGASRVMVLCFCIAGIWSAYVTQGVLQETLDVDGHPVYGIKYTLAEYVCTFLVAGGVSAFVLAKVPKTSAWDIMLGMNLWGSIYNLVYMFGLPYGSGFESHQFCRKHPEAAWDIFLFCLCGAGQHHNHNNPQICKHCSVFTGDWQSTFREAMGKCYDGLLWDAVPAYQIYLKWRKMQKKKKTT